MTGFIHLLRSQEKTTFLLEQIIGDKLRVHVIRQERMVGQSDRMMRESYMYTENGHYIVSHNIVLIDLTLVPAGLYENDLLNQYGIGKTISLAGMHSTRQMIQHGWRRQEEVVNFVKAPVDLVFLCMADESIPFKEYTMTFAGFDRPGIHLMEYFNPHLYDYSMENRAAVRHADKGGNRVEHSI